MSGLHLYLKCFRCNDREIVAASNALCKRARGNRNIRSCVDFRVARDRQYFRTLRSTRSDQACMPPVRLQTLLNPALCRNSAALTLRGPILHTATIFWFTSSSFNRWDNSGRGINCPPMLEISYSNSSRTSRRKRFSPASSLCFSSSTRI